MRVGVITFHKVLNYGAVLQAYALCEVLKSMGHEPFLIDYQPEKLMKPYRTFPVGKLFFTPAQVSFLLRWKHFNSFVQTYLRLSDVSYQTLTELAQNPPDADAYICGSDQIWCPKWLGNEYDPTYFLPFGSDVRRIAYAASMGDVKEIYEPQRLSKLLSCLDHISVREEGAIEPVSTSSGKNVDCVIDPVFLLKDYDQLLPQKFFSGNYILNYSLYGLPLLEDAVHTLSKSLSVKKRRITRNWKFWKYSGTPEFCVSPERWLRCFHDADAVVTDSFHGTSFSLIFHRPFLCILANHRKGGSHRILELLRKVGLEDRVVEENDSEENVRERLSRPIDWQNIDRHIYEMREHAMNFLQRALGEEE